MSEFLAYWGHSTLPYLKRLSTTPEARNPKCKHFTSTTQRCHSHLHVSWSRINPMLHQMGWTSSFGGSNGVDLWECFHAFYNPHFFAQKYSRLSRTWQTHIDNGFKILFMFWMCKTPYQLNPQIPTYHSKNWIALPLVEASLAMEQEQERESWIPP